MAEWVSPTGYNDPGDTWNNETNIYDEDQATYATTNIPRAEWSNFVELTLTSAITSNKVRFDADWNELVLGKIDLDVYKDGDWVHVYEGGYTDHAWVEKTFTQGSVTKARASFYNAAADPYLTQKFYEFDFWKMGVEYEVTLTESLGMVDSVARAKGMYQTIVDSLGMLDSTPTKALFHLSVSDSLGMLDTVKAPGRVEVEITDLLGMLDSATRRADFKQAIEESLGLSDSVGTKAAFKQAVSDVLGMLDSAARSKGVHITVSEILGLRDSILYIVNPTILARLIKKYLQLESLGGD